jgi:hypothetical protein
MIHQPTTGDGEHPRPEPGQITFERLNALGNAQPHVARKIVGNARLGTPQETQQPRLKVDEQHFGSPLLACAGTHDDVGEDGVVEDHGRMLHHGSIGTPRPDMSERTSRFGRIHPAAQVTDAHR